MIRSNVEATSGFLRSITLPRFGCAHAKQSLVPVWVVNFSAASKSEQLIQILQDTLVELEATSGLSSDSPDLLALKSIILNRIAQLELVKADENTSRERLKVTRTETVPETAQIDPDIAAKTAA